MTKKTFVDFLQNLTLLLLTVSAVMLMMQFPMLDDVLDVQMHALLSAPERTENREIDLTTALSAVHLVVTDEIEYGRYAGTNLSTAGAEFAKVLPLLREAVGSASPGREATHVEFRTALKSAGIYVDLTTNLPLQIVAAWLGEEIAREDEIRAFALTTVRDNAVLFFLKTDGALVRSESALASSAVRDIAATFQPNGGQFAFDTDYASLKPYTVLVRDVGKAERVTASVPVGYSAFNLLTALKFNAHTNSRYTESSGAEVIMQTPRTLKIRSDGTVRYSSDGEVTEPLFRITAEAGEPTASDVLKGACLLAAALTDGTNAAELSVAAVEKTSYGWVISFAYRACGLPVLLAEGNIALRVVVTGDTITEFDYRCRAYTAEKETGELLPPSIAAAIASMHDGTELILAYIDNGTATLDPRWLAE